MSDLNDSDNARIARSCGWSMVAHTKVYCGKKYLEVLSTNSIISACEVTKLWHLVTVTNVMNVLLHLPKTHCGTCR